MSAQTNKNRRNVLVLAAAAVAFLLVAFVLSRGSALPPGPDGGVATAEKKRAPVVYPRDKKRPKHPRPDSDAGPAPAAAGPSLDAMQRALLQKDGKGAVFVEANAIRHSPLMEKMLRCRQKENGDGLEDMKDKLGIDPMEDVDRIGFNGDVFVASGFFSKMKVPEELGAPEAYGDGGQIWHAKGDEGQEMYFGKVGDGMLMTAADPAALKAAMDRSTGQADPSTPPALPAGFGEGEVYGTVGAAFLQSVLGDSKDPVAQSVAKLVTQSTVRMNVDEDAALSLDLSAVDDKSAVDLSSAVRGGLAGLHAKAVSDGDDDLAHLLEQARVTPGEGGKFNVDVAVPGETLLRGMGCDKDGNPVDGAKPKRKR